MLGNSTDYTGEVTEQTSTSPGRIRWNSPFGMNDPHRTGVAPGAGRYPGQHGGIPRCGMSVGGLRSDDVLDHPQEGFVRQPGPPRVTPTTAVVGRVDARTRRRPGGPAPKPLLAAKARQSMPSRSAAVSCSGLRQQASSRWATSPCLARRPPIFRAARRARTDGTLVVAGGEQLVVFAYRVGHQRTVQRSIEPLTRRWTVRASRRAPGPEPGPAPVLLPVLSSR